MKVTKSFNPVKTKCRFLLYIHTTKFAFWGHKHFPQAVILISSCFKNSSKVAKVSISLRWVILHYLELESLAFKWFTRNSQSNYFLMLFPIYRFPNFEDFSEIRSSETPIIFYY